MASGARAQSSQRVKLPYIGRLHHGTLPNETEPTDKSVLDGSNYTLTHVPHKRLPVTTGELETYKLIIQDQSHNSSNGGEQVPGLPL